MRENGPGHPGHPRQPGKGPGPPPAPAHPPASATGPPPRRHAPGPGQVRPWPAAPAGARPWLARTTQRTAPPGHGRPPPGLRAWLAGINLAWLETGECSHRRQSPGYRPSRALTHLIQVRQVTCTAPGCRRPATSCDFEHTIPYHAGGRTCECNGGPCCRRHHRAKQAPRMAAGPAPPRHLPLDHTPRAQLPNPTRPIPHLSPAARTAHSAPSGCARLPPSRDFHLDAPHGALPNPARPAPA